MFKYIKFADLPVTDQERAVAFYTGKLGLRVARDSPYQEDWRWIELELPGAETKILFTRRNDETPNDVPSLIFVTGDVEARYETLKKKGVVFTQAPSQAAWNPEETFALLRDSEGNTILLSSQ